MEAATTIIGGLIIAWMSRLIEKGATVAQVRIFVLLACLGAGVVSYLVMAGPPTDLQSWSAITVFASGSFGVAAALYKWVLARPATKQEDELRELFEVEKRSTWI